MLVNGLVALESTLSSAVPDFFCKLAVVLFKEFQKSFLLDSDTEVGIFEFGSGDISVCLHQFLITAVYLHTDLINGYVDFLRLDTFARSTVVFHIP